MFEKYKIILNTNKSSNEALLVYIKEELKGKIPERYKNTQNRIKLKKDKNSITFIIIIVIIVLILITIIIIFIKKKKKNSQRLLSTDLEKVNNSLFQL